jgi:hypothetical protein
MSFDRQAARALFNSPESRAPVTPDRTQRRTLASAPDAPRARDNAVNPGLEETEFAKGGDLYARLSAKPKRNPVAIAVPVVLGLAIVGAGAIYLLSNRTPTQAPAETAAPAALSTTATTPAPAATPAPAPVAAAPATPVVTEPAKPVTTTAAPARPTATVRPAARVATRAPAPRPRATAPADTTPTPVNPPTTATAASQPAPIVLPPPLPAPTPEPTAPQ